MDIFVYSACHFGPEQCSWRKLVWRYQNHTCLCKDSVASCSFGAAPRISMATCLPGFNSSQSPTASQSFLTFSVQLTSTMIDFTLSENQKQLRDGARGF